MSDEVLSQFQAAPEQEEKKASRVLKFGIIGTGWIAEHTQRYCWKWKTPRLPAWPISFPARPKSFA